MAVGWGRRTALAACLVFLQVNGHLRGTAVRAICQM
jgi:prophage maintenance system killer protein